MQNSVSCISIVSNWRKDRMQVNETGKVIDLYVK